MELKRLQLPMMLYLAVRVPLLYTRRVLPLDLAHKTLLKTQVGKIEVNQQTIFLLARINIVTILTIKRKIHFLTS